MVDLRLAAVIGLLGVASTTDASDDARVAAQTADVLQRGRVIYLQQCASCHGVHGEGAPDWQQLNTLGEMPAPPHGPQGHTWKHADGMLYRIVHDGWRDPFNKTNRLTMPAFATTLKPIEIHDVIEYIKTMWTPKERDFQREESRQAPFPPEAR